MVSIFEASQGIHGHYGLCFTLLDGMSNNLHYENMPMQYTEIFFNCKNFIRKKNDSFYIFAQNIDRWYTLEPPRIIKGTFIRHVEYSS